MENMDVLRECRDCVCKAPSMRRTGVERPGGRPMPCEIHTVAWNFIRLFIICRSEGGDAPQKQLTEIQTSVKHVPKAQAALYLLTLRRPRSGRLEGRGQWQPHQPSNFAI